MKRMINSKNIATLEKVADKTKLVGQNVEINGVSLRSTNGGTVVSKRASFDYLNAEDISATLQQMIASYIASQNLFMRPVELGDFTLYMEDRLLVIECPEHVLPSYMGITITSSETTKQLAITKTSSGWSFAGNAVNYYELYTDDESKEGNYITLWIGADAHSEEFEEADFSLTEADYNYFVQE